MEKWKTEGTALKVLGIGLLALCVFNAQAQSDRCRALDLKCKLDTGARAERNAYNEARNARKEAGKAWSEQIKSQEKTCNVASELKSRNLPDALNLPAANCKIEEHMTRARQIEYHEAKREEALRKKQYQDAKKRTGAWR
jgi:hypothetical protein